jgi:predicted dehydrogenase
MASVLRVALVGYGYWGPNYARVLNELADTELVAICEVDPGKLRRAKSRHSRTLAHTDIRDVLEDKSIEAVIVSTPPSTHYELARLFLESGRHVLLEKPMALNVGHCEELGELAERKGLVLMVGYTFLYNAGIRKMKECIGSSDFGRTYYLHSTRTNLGPVRHDVNAVWDLAPHDISIFNYLLDQQPSWASAVGSRILQSGREDVSFITLGYPDGVVGNIHVSWADPNKVREVVAVGSRRRVVFDDLKPLEQVRIFEKGVSVGDPMPETFGEFKLLVRDGDIISPKVEAREPLKEQCNDFVASIFGNRKPFSDAALGTRITRALIAVDASMRENGAPKEVI